MSQYIHFFIRSTDQLLPLYTASRASFIYQFYSDYAPYEKVSVLSIDELRKIHDEIRAQLDEWNKRIRDLRNELHLIASFNNSIDEKFEALDRVRFTIRGLEEDAEDMEKALYFTRFLMDIYNEAEDESMIKYLYFGIECGTPSIAEIEEWENSRK